MRYHIGLLVLAMTFSGCERSAATGGSPAARPTPAANEAAAPPAAAQESGMQNPGSKIPVDQAKLSGDLGSKTNPVRCDFPAGERAYLSRLRCQKGGIGGGPAPKFERRGSVGIGPYGNVLDVYEVECGASMVEVYIDMYHPGYVEPKAVPGFNIVP